MDGRGREARGMRINGVQCEDCRKIHHIRYDLSDKYPSSREIPDNWIVVVRCGDTDGKGSLHFCSIRCLGQWIRTEEDKALEEC